MGYVDCDTHIIETATTWDYMDPGEEHFRPMINGSRWNVEDLEMDWPTPMARKWQDVVFSGTDLVDIKARLRHMDDFGVDVQVLFPTWWLLYPVASPAQEAAMYRSYNRWMADALLPAEAGCAGLRWPRCGAWTGPTRRWNTPRPTAPCRCSCSARRTG